MCEIENITKLVFLNSILNFSAYKILILYFEPKFLFEQGDIPLFVDVIFVNFGLSLYLLRNQLFNQTNSKSKLN